MSRKLVPVALCYDFDGTLAPGNMQERDFIPHIGMKTKAFWDEVSSRSETHNADNILIYMQMMLEKAQAAAVPVRKQDFMNYGKSLDFYPGVFSSKDDNWFSRINEYGRATGVRVEHYIVSSGIREMVEGTSLKKFFKAIYASSFVYDHHGVAKWPALALNYTTKTQYLFRINKGSLDVYDHSVINEYVPHLKRAVPFSNMVYIGDGLTDIPCFRLVKDKGGHSIAVYEKSNKAKLRAKKMLDEGRVDFMTQTDYSSGSDLDRVVKGIIDKAAFDTTLRSLGKS